MFAAMAELAIGLVYELLGSAAPQAGDPDDFDAEYEPLETLEALEAAFRRLGHRPLRLGRPHDLLKTGHPPVDAALSIAEGYGTRNREAWAPVLLEMLGVPRLGSDALTLSLSLDKAWTRSVVSEAGVPVAPGAVMRSVDDARGWRGPFPAFVKPRFEGSSKGIVSTSRVESESELVAEVERSTRVYRQPALVEAFLAGAEYTVCVTGNDPARCHPALQRALDPASRIGHHALGEPGEPQLVGNISPALEATLAEYSTRAYQALDCLDFARLDFKLDDEGAAHFLEINTLPTFAPDGSFAILAELEGRPFDVFLAEIFATALRRLGLPG